jgi:hypothetical protein
MKIRLFSAIIEEESAPANNLAITQIRYRRRILILFKRLFGLPPRISSVRLEANDLPKMLPSPSQPLPSYDKIVGVLLFQVPSLEKEYSKDAQERRKVERRPSG